MLTKIFSKIVEWILISPSPKFKFDGYIDYPGIGIIKDVDVYRLIINHSRLIDRLNPAKMVEMTLLGQNILMGIFEKIDPYDFGWKFYGKYSIFNIKDWG